MITELKCWWRKNQIIQLFEGFVHSCRVVAAEFNRRHLQLAPITYGKAATINTLLNEIDSVTKINQNGQPWQISPHPKDNDIMAAYRANPRMSLWDLSSQLNISKDKIRCFLHKFKDDNCRYWVRVNLHWVISCKDQYSIFWDVIIVFFMNH